MLDEEGMFSLKYTNAQQTQTLNQRWLNAWLFQRRVFAGCQL